MRKAVFGLLALIACGLSISVRAELLAERTVLRNDSAGDRVRVSARFAQPVQGDLYLATQLGGVFYFFDENGGLTTDVVPRIRNTGYSGDVPVLNLPVQGVAAGRYFLYQVVTAAGANPLFVANWISPLNVMLFHIGLPTEVTRDFDQDGFPDDDRNRDGFFDADTNMDGVVDFQENIAQGRVLYEMNCQNSGCHQHGNSPGQNANGVLLARNDPGVIRSAIRRNKGGMIFLDTLSDADLQAIADYLGTF